MYAYTNVVHICPESDTTTKIRICLFICRSATSQIAIMALKCFTLQHSYMHVLLISRYILTKVHIKRFNTFDNKTIKTNCYGCILHIQNEKLQSKADQSIVQLYQTIQESMIENRKFRAEFREKCNITWKKSMKFRGNSAKNLILDAQFIIPFRNIPNSVQRFQAILSVAFLA